MPMYNLLEYSKNYLKISGTLWNYYRDELSDEEPDANGLNKNVINSKSFKYKTSITGITYDIAEKIIGGGGNPVPNPAYDENKRGTKEVEIAVPLKPLGNFWSSLNILLINFEVFLTLTWSENCVITNMKKRVVIAAQGNNPAVHDNFTTNSTFAIKDTKLYVPVVTLSAENDNKLLEQSKTEFKRTIKCNKYRSDLSNQTKTNNLNYLIDPTFTKVNRLFVLSFPNEEGRISFAEYYPPIVEIKYFYVLIDQRSFFDVPMKKKEESYEKIIEMSKNNDYTTGNL